MAKPIAALSLSRIRWPVRSETPHSLAIAWAEAPRASEHTMKAARNQSVSGSLVCAIRVPLVAENCQPQPVQRNSLRPLTLAYPRCPQSGHSNPSGHLSPIMCSSQASSVPNLSMSSAMLPAIPLGAFSAAVLALDFDLALPLDLAMPTPPTRAVITLTLSRSGWTEMRPS